MTPVLTYKSGIINNEFNITSHIN